MTRRGMAICILVLSFSSAAWAENFTVRVRISCPAHLASNNRVDTTMSGTPTFVPCANVLVKAYDSDTDWDDYCGGGYTDSSGYVSFSASCSDVWGQPDIYLRVYAQSSYGNGFRVGRYDYGILDGVWDAITSTLLNTAYNALTDTETFTWVTSEKYPNNGSVLDWGWQSIGSNNTSSWSRMAAKVYWLANLTMKQFAGSSYTPGFTTFMVDHPFFGTPTTIWDTVIIKDSLTASDPSKALRAIPHEVGHVVYNRYHSGFGHWIADAVTYMKNHDKCGDYGSMFGWYEGFAHFVRDYAFAGLNDRYQSSSNYRKYDGCGTKGLHIEGNVNAFLNMIYFGDYRSAVTPPEDYGFRWNNGLYNTTRTNYRWGGTYDFYLPSLSEMLRFVQNAGSNAHTASQFWASQIKAYCLAKTSWGSYRYCNPDYSDTFFNDVKRVDSGVVTRSVLYYYLPVYTMVQQ